MPLPEFTIKHYAGKVTYQVRAGQPALPQVLCPAGRRQNHGVGLTVIPVLDQEPLIRAALGNCLVL